MASADSWDGIGKRDICRRLRKFKCCPPDERQNSTRASSDCRLRCRRSAFAAAVDARGALANACVIDGAGMLGPDQQPGTVARTWRVALDFQRHIARSSWILLF